MTEEKPASLADVLKNIERDPPKTAGEKKETDVVNIVDEIEKNKDERDRIDSLYNICMECHGLDFCRMKYKWYREEYIFPEIYDGRFSARVVKCNYVNMRNMQLERNRLLALSGLPKELEGRSFQEDCKDLDDSSLGKIRTAIETSQSLYIYGSSIEKADLIAAVIANDGMKHGTPAYYKAYTDILKGITDDEKSKMETIETLILSNVASERLTPAADDALTDILTAREKESKQTLITSLIKLDELTSYLSYYDSECYAEIRPERIQNLILDWMDVINIG